MSNDRRRGGRAPLDVNGSTVVPTRFGQADLARIDQAWNTFGSTDRSAFIRQAAVDKAATVVDGDALARENERRTEAMARKHDTAVLTVIEAELFAAVADLVGRRTPYAWGGGTITGPTLGQSDGGGPADRAGDLHKIGFDSGSLEQYLIFRAFQIEIPRTPQDQFRFGRAVDEPQAGDLVFSEEHMHGGAPGYVATYLGRGCIAEAGTSGKLISMRALPATGVHLRRVAP
ncbi:NlpC/P60 family protein [Mycolicibacterium llatzerense]|uniref:NlpC/P60 family protein n=1 Tax=Mycolicibacterium llatzerense TaxID=280871 RepID=UPI0013A6D0CA|nr:NlpC/P60 family protein [Mycolicibacterium llatzerense]